MQIKSHYSPVCKQNFKAKFVHSDDLRSVVQYAVDIGKFDKLNKSRKNIDTGYIRTRLKFELTTTPQGFPSIKFTRYIPKKYVTVAQTMDDYRIEKVVTIESTKKMNPLKFALKKLIVMGSSVPENKIYQKVVVK